MSTEIMLAIFMFSVTFIALMLLHQRYSETVEENLLLELRLEKTHTSGIDAHERAVEASALILRIVNIVPIEHRMDILKEISKSADTLSRTKK